VENVNELLLPVKDVEASCASTPVSQSIPSRPKWTHRLPVACLDPIAKLEIARSMCRIHSPCPIDGKVQHQKAVATNLLIQCELHEQTGCSRHTAHRVMVDANEIAERSNPHAGHIEPVVKVLQSRVCLVGAPSRGRRQRMPSAARMCLPYGRVWISAVSTALAPAWIARVPAFGANPAQRVCAESPAGAVSLAQAYLLKMTHRPPKRAAVGWYVEMSVMSCCCKSPE
jgi:hypothetical protein